MTTEERLGRIDRQIEALVAVISAQTRQMEARFEQVDARFEQVNARFEQVDGRFEQVDVRFGQVEARFEQMDTRFTSLEKLMEDRSESIEREISTNADRLEAATARNTKVLTGGSKAISGFAAWAEKRDQLDRKRDEEIRGLRARIQKLERGPKHRAS